MKPTHALPLCLWLTGCGNGQSPLSAVPTAPAGALQPPAMMRQESPEGRSTAAPEDASNPAWPELSAAIAAARNPVSVLEPAAGTGPGSLAQMSLSARSTLGALALHTAGLSVGQGWLRVLGGAELPLWNGLGDAPRFKGIPGALLVGYDAAGGIFAIDGGGLGIHPGHVCYLAPDSLDWEGLDVGHTAWVHWTLSGDLSEFYASLRWSSWEQELPQLGRDEVVAFFPFLWTKEGEVETASRKTVPIHEHLAMRLE